jgi:shikimate dehydrogenase
MNNPGKEYFALGLTGYPLEHSLSPRLHTAALRDCGLQGEYLLYPIPLLPAGQAQMQALMDDLRESRLDGLNVTIPHKQSVIPYLDELTPLARQVGAVNTIYRAGKSLVGIIPMLKVSWRIFGHYLLRNQTSDLPC